MTRKYKHWYYIEPSYQKFIPITESMMQKVKYYIAPLTRQLSSSRYTFVVAKKGFHTHTVSSGFMDVEGFLVAFRCGRCKEVRYLMPAAKPKLILDCIKKNIPIVCCSCFAHLSSTSGVTRFF